MNSWQNSQLGGRWSVVCLYLCVFVIVFKNMHVCICVYVFACLSLCLRICMFVFVCMYLLVCICVCVFAFMCLPLRWSKGQLATYGTVVTLQVPRAAM